MGYRMIRRLILVALVGWGGLLLLTCPWVGRFWSGIGDPVASDYFDDPQVVSLCEAVHARNLDRVRELISHGVDCSVVGKDGMTPLLWAYPTGQADIVELLLEAGADPNVRFSGSYTAVPSVYPGVSFSALAFLSSHDYFDVTMQHGLDPNYEYSSGHRLLHAACGCREEVRSQRVSALVAAGADVDATGSVGESPAVYSLLRCQNYDLATLLIELGADPKHVRDNDLFYLMDRAIIRHESAVKDGRPDPGFEEFVELLESKGESYEESKEYLRARRTGYKKRRTPFAAEWQARVAESLKSK